MYKDELKQSKGRKLKGEKFSEREETEYRNQLVSESMEKLVRYEEALKQAYMEWETAQLHMLEPYVSIGNYYVKWLEAREEWVMERKRFAERLGYSLAPIVPPVTNIVNYGDLTAKWDYNSSEQGEKTNNQTCPLKK